MKPIAKLLIQNSIVVVITVLFLFAIDKEFNYDKKKLDLPFTYEEGFEVAQKHLVYDSNGYSLLATIDGEKVSFGEDESNYENVRKDFFEFVLKQDVFSDEKRVTVTEHYRVEEFGFEAYEVYYTFKIDVEEFLLYLENTYDEEFLNEYEIYNLYSKDYFSDKQIVLTYKINIYPSSMTEDLSVDDEIYTVFKAIVEDGENIVEIDYSTNPGSEISYFLEE